MTKIKWDHQFYDSRHSFIAAYGEALLPLLDPQPHQRILDLGCGTGDLTFRIAEYGAEVVGIDSSEEMISGAKEKYPNISFEVKDATDFYFNKPFDAVFSNATLHWVEEKEKAIDCMFRNLKSGGKLVAEFGGKGNVGLMLDAWQESMKKLKIKPEKDLRIHWYFPSIGEYTCLLESKGFELKYALHFDRLTELTSDNGIKDWFKMFGERLLEGLSPMEIDQVLNETQRSVKDSLFKNGKWHADYKRIRIVAVKP